MGARRAIGGRIGRTALPAALALILAAPALAKPDRQSPAGEADDDRERPSFWQTLRSPHAAEVAALSAEASFLRFTLANQYYEAHAQPARHKVLGAALARYERAAELEPNRAELRLEAGHAALEAGEYQRAVTNYLAFRERSRDAAVLVAFNLGEAYIYLRRWDEAIFELEGLVGRVDGGERGRCLLWLGYAYMGRGRLDEAIEALERGVASAPAQHGGVDVVGRLLLAVAYDRDEQLERANALLEEIRAVDPQFSLVWQPVIMLANQPPSTRFYLLAAPPADRHYAAGLVLSAMGRRAEAATAFRAYLAARAPLYARRAHAHLAQLAAPPPRGPAK